MGLNVLTMLRRGGWAIASLLLAWSGNAAADDINFNGGAVSNCSLSSKTYTCGSIPLVNWNDRAIIASGYTVVSSSSFAPGYNHALVINSGATLQTSGSAGIDLTSINPANISTSNATLIAGGSVRLASSTTINGSISAASLNTNADVTISGSVSVSGTIYLGSRVKVGGAVSAASISTDSAVTLSSSLTVSGLADLGSEIKIGGNVTANAVKTGSPALISGAIDSRSSVDLGSGTTVGGSIKGTVVSTGSPVTLNGAVTATTSFSLGSGSSVTGNISAPSVTLASSNSTIKGDISTSGRLDMGSGVSVTGTVNAGSAILRGENARINGNTTISGALELQSGTSVTGTVTAASLTLRASNARINGNATISGDVLLESGTSITGDLTARNVDTKNGNAIIYGNATVYSIYIDGNNRVDGCITCIGAPADAPYRCVSKPDWYNYTPHCTGSGSSIHHFQISHSGRGLTCQAQPVEIKACTDVNCTATVSTTTKVTLSPGGGDVDVSGTTRALVRYATATATDPANPSAGVTLSAIAAGITNPNVCPNAATGTNNCNMVFQDEGLVLSAPDHVAKTPNILLSVQALKTSPQGSCVPLVQGATVPVKFSCNYVNPLPASANQVPVTVGGTPLSCGSGTTNVNLSFNSDGLATPSLQYAEVGLTGLTAAYTAGGLGASGAVQFTTAPASIKIEPIRINASGNFSETAFAKASEPFKLRLSALNYNKEVTKNFGRESPTPQNFFIPAPVLTAPLNGNRPLTIGTYKGIVNGVADANDGVPGQWRFDDTGTLKVTVMLDNSTGYLGKTAPGFNPTGEASLVFVPDHFDVTLPAGVPMACAQLGVLSNPCGSLNASGKFVYSRQPFGLVINAYTGLKDANNLYVAPQNYVGADARPIKLSAHSAADSTTAIAGGNNGIGDFNWTTSPPATSQFTFAYDQASKKTTGTLAPGATLPSYDFRQTPTAPTTMLVRATDSDGATSAGFAEPLLTVVSGRMEIANVSGPLTGTVPVTARAQYWNGRAYVFNSQYNSGDVQMWRTESNGAKSYFVKFSNCKNGLYSGNANAPCPAGSTLKLASDTIKFSNGSGIFRLATPAPALSRNGSVDVTLKNPVLENPSDKDQDRKSELIQYLPSGTGTVIFGVYRSGPVIYTREVYN